MEILDGKYEVDRDQYNWVLTERVPGKSKKGEPITSERRTYHGTFPQVCQFIIDRELGDVSEIESVVNRVDEVFREIRKTYGEG